MQRNNFSTGEQKGKKSSFSVPLKNYSFRIFSLSSFSLLLHYPLELRIYHGEIQVNTSASEGITPILMGPGGGIVLGIDYSRRIVYWGDTDMSSNLSGTGATSENHINNTAGTINNDASKLIANVFAWITETVLYGE